MSDPGDEIIRITREEAADRHVDDLLQRQMSLRGETGMARDRRRPWFYQSWLVLMLAGVLGAVAAWAIIEPRFDDKVYFQGALEEADVGVPDWKKLAPIEGELLAALEAGADGWIQIKGEKIWLLETTKKVAPDGSRSPLVSGDLAVGQTVGVWVELMEIPGGRLAATLLLDPAPRPAETGDRAGMTLAQLGAQSDAMGLLIFPLVAGFVGLFIGAADGIVCRLPRRALIGGGRSGCWSAFSAGSSQGSSPT